MAGHEDAGVMTGHIGTNTPKFVPPRRGRRPFDPTQTGLCKFGWIWSSLSFQSRLTTSITLETFSLLTLWSPPQNPFCRAFQGVPTPLSRLILLFQCVAGVSQLHPSKRALSHPIPGGLRGVSQASKSLSLQGVEQLHCRRVALHFDTKLLGWLAWNFHSRLQISVP